MRNAINAFSSEGELPGNKGNFCLSKGKASSAENDTTALIEYRLNDNLNLKTMVSNKQYTNNGQEGFVYGVQANGTIFTDYGYIIQAFSQDDSGSTSLADHTDMFYAAKISRPITINQGEFSTKENIEAHLSYAHVESHNSTDNTNDTLYAGLQVKGDKLSLKKIMQK